MFGENDRVHFGDMGVAMLALFQAATLSAWGDMYMVNAYGCERYDSGGAFERRNATDVRVIRTLCGSFNHWDCVAPTPMPVTAAVYFYTFTLLTAFVVLSLFISVITTAMFEARERRARGARARAERARRGGGSPRGRSSRPFRVRSLSLSRSLSQGDGVQEVRDAAARRA